MGWSSEKELIFPFILMTTLQKRKETFSVRTVTEYLLICDFLEFISAFIILKLNPGHVKYVVNDTGMMNKVFAINKTERNKWERVIELCRLK